MSRSPTTSFTEKRSQNEASFLPHSSTPSHLLPCRFQRNWNYGWLNFLHSHHRNRWPSRHGGQNQGVSRRDLQLSGLGQSNVRISGTSEAEDRDAAPVAVPDRRQREPIRAPMDRVPILQAPA